MAISTVLAEEGVAAALTEATARDATSKAEAMRDLENNMILVFLHLRVREEAVENEA